MRYEIKITCKDQEEARAIRDMLDGVVECEIVHISEPSDYQKLDVRGWPMAKWMLSKMDPSRHYDRYQLAEILEEMGWSANSAGTLLVKLTQQGVLRKSGTLYKKVGEI